VKNVKGQRPFDIALGTGKSRRDGTVPVKVDSSYEVSAIGTNYVHIHVGFSGYRILVDNINSNWANIHAVASMP
jgi:hypothetical protein